MRLRSPAIALALVIAFTVTGTSEANADTRGPETIINHNTGISDSHLPALAATGTYWAGAGLAGQIRDYRNSGQYVQQRTQILHQASEFLDNYLRSRCSPKSCKPAVVFDFDDTLVSWYEIYEPLNFSPNSSVTTPALNNCQTPPIAEGIALLRHAQDKGATAYVVTGRPEEMRQITEACMTKVGIKNATLILRQADQSTLTAKAYKSATRAGIERAGETIVLNVGDQVSDIAGGHAKGQFVVPNPVYFIP